MYFFVAFYILGVNLVIVGLAPKSLIITQLIQVIIAIRIPFEEQVLLENLSGYKNYTTKVRSRLYPGLW